MIDEKQSCYDKAIVLYKTITDYAIKNFSEECLNLLNTAWGLCETGRTKTQDPLEQCQYLDLENKINSKIKSIESNAKVIFVQYG